MMLSKKNPVVLPETPLFYQKAENMWQNKLKVANVHFKMEPFQAYLALLTSQPS